MVEVTIRKYSCLSCPDHMAYYGSTPQKIKGAFLKAGYRYCTGGKRTRQFKSRDPKKSVPSWCPRLKSPAALRIYHYKDSNTEFIQTMLRMDGLSANPNGYEYAVRLESTTELTAAAFMGAVEGRSAADVLGIPVQAHEIVEIDDGLKPYFFYLESVHEVHCIYFDAGRARENTLEVEDGGDDEPDTEIE